MLFVIATPAEKDGYYQAAQFAEKRAATYPALLTAPEVLDRTRSSLGLDMPASALIPMLTATNPTDSSLVEVAATAGTLELASQLAGTAAQNLADYAVDLEASGSSGSAVTIKLAVPAREPQYASSPSPLMLGALGGLAGGALGVMTALAINALRRRPRASGREAAATSTAATAPLDGHVHAGQPASLAAVPPTEPASAPLSDGTSDAGDEGTPPPSPEPTPQPSPEPTQPRNPSALTRRTARARRPTPRPPQRPRRAWWLVQP